jgi:hypothetical protein
MFLPKYARRIYKTEVINKYNSGDCILYNVLYSFLSSLTEMDS